MLQTSSPPENPTTSNQKNEEVAGGGGSSSVGLEEEERAGLEEGYRNWSGNRWPRQETLALLKIRSDMDAQFKEASIKLPLWGEVSRKMEGLGYIRSAKKCKEKFENIYKYHRRTKESGRPNGKVYRFTEQLEALDYHQSQSEPPPPRVTEKVKTSEPEIAKTPTNVIYTAIRSSSVQLSVPSFVDNSSSTTSSSSKESQGTHKKKRRLADFFERMMKEVVDKQESLQNKFAEVLDKYEHDRLAREEAWKRQELARIKRERELLVQERSVAAAKDAAVLAFLQKYSEQAGSPQFPVPLPKQPPSVPLAKQPPSVQLPEQTSPVQFLVQTPSVQLPEQPPSVQLPVSSMVDALVDKQKKNCDASLVLMSSDTQERNNGKSYINMSGSRWPKEEVEALVQIRSKFDLQYQENGPKGHLWEEISAAMEKLGYDRSAKRCKEKWENINKYFRRMKESNKRRPEDSKTCAYFYLLDDLYSKKTDKADNSNQELKPEELLMHMMGGQQVQHQSEPVTKAGESENVDHIQQDTEKADGDGFRTVAGNPRSTEEDNPSVEIMS